MDGCWRWCSVFIIQVMCWRGDRQASWTLGSKVNLLERLPVGVVWRLTRTLSSAVVDRWNVESQFGISRSVAAWRNPRDQVPEWNGVCEEDKMGRKHRSVEDLISEMFSLCTTLVLRTICHQPPGSTLLLNSMMKRSNEQHLWCMPVTPCRKVRRSKTH